MGTAGLLLTGGASRRMGADKALLVIEGQVSAVRLGRLLAAAASPALEVGPGASGLPAIREHPRGQGPLVAIAAGATHLQRLGASGPALVLACDLPLVTGALLEHLAHWPGDGAVVPVVDGHRQPLCARWSASDLAAAIDLAAKGQRSLRGLPAHGEHTDLGPEDWGPLADARTFADVDSPEDLARLGVRWQPGRERAAD